MTGACPSCGHTAKAARRQNWVDRLLRLKPGCPEKVYDYATADLGAEECACPDPWHVAGT